MSEMTYEQVLTAALALRPEQKKALVSALQAEARPVLNPIREQLIMELYVLRLAGVFERVDSLRNQYRAAALEYVTDQELLAAIHESAAEWEAGLEEDSGNDN